MAMDRIRSARAKIYRAKKHIDDLKLELTAFRESDPYRAHFYDDVDTGDRVGELQVVEEPPFRVLAIIGDAIHNLRSSLDHIACELCAVSGGTVSTSTAFPIWEIVPANVEADIRRKIPDASAEVIDGIKALEPYKGGKGDILWRLHVLDIVDKHRLLITAAASTYFIDLRFRRWEPDWLFPDVPRPLKGLPPRGVALKHNAKLLRVPRSARLQTEMNVDPKFSFQIAFGEILEGEPVIPALEKFVNAVNDVVSAFRGILN